MKSYLLALGLVGLELGGVSAQQALWGQCGGIGWTGPTTCVSGAVCVYLNAYHYQCLAGTTTTTATSTTPVPEPTAPPGSLSIKTSCVNTTIQQDWFIGWCLPAGKGSQRIQSSVYIGNKLQASTSGILGWGSDTPYTRYCNSCQLQNLSELSCICPAGGLPLFRTTINLEEHIANYKGHLLSDLSGPRVAPSTSSSILFPSDVGFGYNPGDTTCYYPDSPNCAFLTANPKGCDIVISGRPQPLQCNVDWYDSTPLSFGFMEFVAYNSAYKFKLWDNLDCSGAAYATIVPSQYSKCVKFRKRLVAWSSVPQWNADL
ncbi:hypothetical protein ABW20_dc0102340 [Dactylellina cionopaga]|nr:hypothetical protein ABW20_dc0102340 [Dactylellina cionopaga]